MCDTGSRWLQWQVRWSNNRMRVTLSLSASFTHSLPFSDDWLQSGGSDGQGVFSFFPIFPITSVSSNLMEVLTSSLLLSLLSHCTSLNMFYISPCPFLHCCFPFSYPLFFLFSHFPLPPVYSGNTRTLSLSSST